MLIFVSQMILTNFVAPLGVATALLVDASREFSATIPMLQLTPV